MTRNVTLALTARPVLRLTALVAAIALLTLGPARANPIAAGIAKSDVKVSLKLVGDGLTMPLWAASPPDGSGRLFVIDQVGQVYVIKNGKMAKKPALDVADRMVQIKQGFDERGLLGIAFHPGFADKASPGYGRVYTYTSEPVSDSIKPDYPLTAKNMDHQSVVAEWRMSSSNPDMIDPSTRREVLRFGQPQFNHDGGGIAFGPDGMLYIGTGDGGAAMDKGDGHTEPQGNSQDLSNALGKILRIDPLAKSGRIVKGRFSVPSDNPFVGKKGHVDAIWAYGLRNPFRLSFDRKSGILVTGDVGQNNIEEIDIIEKGGNYGWRIKEGSFWFNTAEGHVGEVSKQPYSHSDTKAKLIDPVAEYDHDEGISVIGGFVYRGKSLKALNGLYIVGEWKRKPKKSSGRLFTCDLKTGELRELFPGGKEIGQFVCGMGEDGAGEVYVLTTGSIGPKGNTGKVYKLVAGK